MDSDFIRVPELLLGRIDHRHRRRPSSVQIHRYSSPTHHQFEFTPNEQPASTTRGRFTVQTPRSNPGLALRTTFISGFPGETEEEHEELMQFCREFKFERLGRFAYSEESSITRANTRTKSGRPSRLTPRSIGLSATRNLRKLRAISHRSNLRRPHRQL